MKKLLHNQYFSLVLFTLVEILLVVISVGLGILLRPWLQIDNDYPILREAQQLLMVNGLKNPPQIPQLEYGMVRGMLQSYNDPYTIFVEPPQHELETDQLNGKYGGIGVQIEKDKNGRFLVFPYKDSPASKAGILEASELVSIDQLTINPETKMEQIQAAFRGPVPQEVSVSVKLPPDYQKTSNFKIAREEIPIPSVTSRLYPEDNTIGIIQINLIADTTAEEIDRAIQTLKPRGANKYILDLRNNGGGLVDGGLKIAALFTKQDPEIIETFRDQAPESRKTKKTDKYPELPLVVLVNHNTASASEIAAGILQAQKRAVLVGVPTYGKNTLQLVFDLKDGSSIHITSARWQIPSWPLPKEGEGLAPDIVLDEEQTNTPQIFEKALQGFKN
jgi:carboxyl-terminal processing protease